MISSSYFFAFLIWFCTKIEQGKTITASVSMCSAISLAANQCLTIGGIMFTQENDNGPVRITGSITLGNISTTSLGFHIHEYGSINDICAGAGSHYNPTNQTHGAPWSQIRHIGDLGNINFTENSQTATLNFTDSVIQLKGVNSIVGRTLVLHNGTDDYGKNASSADSLKTGNAGARLSCGIIGITSDFNVADVMVTTDNNTNNNTLVKPIIASVNLYSAVPGVNVGFVIGTVNFTQNKTGDPVRISGSIEYFTASNVTSVGFHVHEYGSMFNNCLNAGAHYNPTNQTHGAPWDKTRHVGDLGNVNFTVADKKSVFNFVDSTIQLKGPYSIIGRALVIHSGTDDYGRNDTLISESLKSGNAGGRIACGVIGLISDTSLADAPTPATTIATTVATTVSPTTITTVKTTTACKTSSCNKSSPVLFIDIKQFCLSIFLFLLQLMTSF